MITLSLKKTEQLLNISIQKNIKVLGLDLASKTGWCLLTTNSNKIVLDYGFIDINEKGQYQRYCYIANIFNNLIKSDYRIIIEDTFLKWNVDAFKFLSRLGGIIYAICYFKQIKEPPIWLYASTARKRLGIKGNCKKPEAHQYLTKKLNLNIDNEDIIDAIILSLNGVINEKTTKIQK